MEPQLEGCGKAWDKATLTDVQTLQWSRNLRVAESLPKTAEFVDLFLLQWSRNLRVAER